MKEQKNETKTRFQRDSQVTFKMANIELLSNKADIAVAHMKDAGRMTEKEARLAWREEFAKLVRLNERRLCVARCMEQYTESMFKSSSCKRIKDQKLYADIALGAKYSALRILKQGEENEC